MNPIGRLAAAVVLAACTTAPAVALQTAPHQLRVTNCDPRHNLPPLGAYVPAYYPGNPFYWNDVYGYNYYQPRFVPSQPTLAIDYTNVTSKTMKQIDFGLVARGTLIAEVRDVGTFSPNIEIKHEFGLSPNVFPIGTALPRCVPLRITFEDGSTWRNPNLPRLQRSLYRSQP